MKIVPAFETVDEEFNILSEPELWNEIQNSNRGAFSYLYRRYVKELFRYGIYLFRDKKLVEDVIQDVFVSIWVNREKQVKIRSLKAYLYSSVRRGVLRKKSTEVLKDIEMDEDFISSFNLKVPSREEKIISEESRENFTQQVRKIVNSLSPKQREIIFLRFYQNLSYVEISSMLGIDQNSAYNLTSKAFAAIKTKIKDMELALVFLLTVLLTNF